MRKKILLITSFLIALELGAVSPYINKVYEYMPAPGQCVNLMPEYEAGDDMDAMCAKVEEYIAGVGNGSLINLGAWGGYVTVGFDHTIVNVDGDYDFKIYANAFYADSQTAGGSCEPGIVMVSYDSNGNGLPDDEWYELAGSEYYSDSTIKDYEVTYYRPDSNHVATPDSSSPMITDTEYIYWVDNKGNDGYINKLSYYSQSYFPEWIEGDEITLYGNRLADNAVDESGDGSNYVLYAYDWGYADNHLNTSDLSNFKIEWAVDSDGNSVNLPGVDFVKVYSGVLQSNGWLGECSTEISGMEDLHPTAVMPEGSVSSNMLNNLTISCNNGSLNIYSPISANADIIAISGVCIKSFEIIAGTNSINVSNLHNGIYLLKVKLNNELKIIKFIK
ncbi:MAG: T9SS type A sorting domain-containing protein [Bacteroidales bacterium]